MITGLLILYFLSFVYFIFYHFKFGKPLEFSLIRLIGKYIYLGLFWGIFIYFSISIISDNSYSDAKGDFNQQIHNVNDTQLQTSQLILLRNKEIVTEKEDAYFQWTLYYPSSKLFLPDIYEISEEEDSINVAIDTSQFDKIMLLDASNYSHAAVINVSDEAIHLFDGDFKEIEFSSLRIEIYDEIKLFVLFIAAILGAVYHQLNIKTRSFFTIMKVGLLLTVIAWSSLNIYRLSSIIYKIIFDLA